MDCSALRVAFVQRSGRNDLVKTVDGDPYVDNGANDYLNRGQRLLDSLVTLRHHKRCLVKVMSPGDWSVVCRNVRRVDCIRFSDGEFRYPVSLEQYSDFVFNTSIPAQSSPGIPIVATLVSARLAPEQASDVAGDFAGASDWEDLLFGDDAHVYDRVVWSPPLDRELTVRIDGLWWTEDLSADDSLTWWSVNEPHLVVSAAMAELESDYRNSEGYQDILRSMQSRIEALDWDQANFESGVRGI